MLLLLLSLLLVVLATLPTHAVVGTACITYTIIVLESVCARGTLLLQQQLWP